MRRTSAVGVVVGLALLLPGCFMASEPLSSPGAELDARLVGEWTCVDPDTKAEAAMAVLPFDRSQYFVEWREPGDLSRFRAFPTPVGGRALLNVAELERESKDEWIFVRYALDERGSLQLSVVSDDALEGLQGRAALAEIRKRAAQDALYEPLATCTPQH